MIKPQYRKGVEDIPLPEIIKDDIPVLVVIRNLQAKEDEDDIVQERRINYSDFNDRKWLGRVTYWAITNHHMVETLSVNDADQPTIG